MPHHVKESRFNLKNPEIVKNVFILINKFLIRLWEYLQIEGSPPFHPIEVCMLHFKENYIKAANNVMENPYEVEWFYSSNYYNARQKHIFEEHKGKNSSLRGLERLTIQMSSLKGEENKLKSN